MCPSNRVKPTLIKIELGSAPAPGAVFRALAENREAM